MKTKHLLAAAVAVAPSVVMASQPDIIYILADDLGYADVGFNGSDIQTPNIDRIARQGVQLQNYYVCPVSTPTRAGLMTGRYPIQFGLMRGVIKPYMDFGLDLDEQLLPEMLAEAGYNHRGCFGKWHLGHARSEWWPHNRGFTEFVGCLNGALDFFNHTRDGELDWHHNGESLHEEGYATDLIANHAIEFIESVPIDEPYFAYIPFNAPHAPIQAKKEDIAKYPNRSGKSATYAAMVDCMDQNIGRILEVVEKRGNLDNTIIIFSSDNGGTGSADNGVMRGSKTYTYEGGIRVAACAMWPAGEVSGGQIITERMGYIDIFPTLRAAAYDGVAIPADHKPLDGRDVMPLMQGEQWRGKDRMWFSYLDHTDDSRMERLGVNYGKWKLVVTRPAPDNQQQPQPETLCELFELNEQNQELEVVENSKMEKLLLKELKRFLAQKQQARVGRHTVADQKSFEAPFEWRVKK
ncbi:MAG: sulfatase-like hydrolase/transferase [Rikenellaceae bacterium]